MNLEAQSWIAGFRIAAALDSFPFFWIWGVVFFFLIGSFLTFSAFWGRSSGGFFLVSSCPPPLLSDGASLGSQAAFIVTQDTFSEFFGLVWGGFCVYRPAWTPRSVPSCGLGHRITQLWHRTVGLSCSVPVCHTDLPPLGAGGDLGILTTPAAAQDCVPSCFLFSDGMTWPRPPSLRLWRYFGLSL